MDNLMQVCENGKRLWRYFFVVDGKLKWIDCVGCKTEGDARNVMAKKEMLEKNKFLISNITKNMYELESSSYNRRSYMGQSVKDSTLEILKRHINEITDVWGRCDIRELTEQKIVNYLMKKKRSESWKNSFLSAVREIYKEANWQELDVTVPDLQNFKRKSKKADCLTHAEIKKLLIPDNFRTYTLYLFYLLCYTAGLRLGEVRGAKVRQLIPEKNAFLVDGYIDKKERRTNYNKMGSDEEPKFRVVIIPSFTIQKLVEYINQNNLQEDDYIFIFHNKPLLRKYAYCNFKRAVEKSGIQEAERKLIPHSLRYSYITRMRMNFKPELVQRFAGHNSIEMTDYYTRANIIDSVENMQQMIPEIDKTFS